MLRLHYVRGGHGSPICPKCSTPWDFGHFPFCIQVLLHLVKFSHGTIRYPLRETACRVSVVQGRTMVVRRSAHGLPRMPVRFIPARHVLMRFLTFCTFWSSSHTLFQVLSRLSTDETWRREALEHLCAYGIKRRPSKQ